MEDICETTTIFTVYRNNHKHKIMFQIGFNM